jgi:hypothetical protein
MIDPDDISAAFLRDHPMPEPIEPGLFDPLCRAALTHMGVPDYCRLRRCRREHYCIGPGEPRDLPEEICDGTPVVATLPRCVARADDVWFWMFIIEWQIARLNHVGQPLHEQSEAVPPRQCLPPADLYALDFVAAANDLSGDN